MTTVIMTINGPIGPETIARFRFDEIERNDGTGELARLEVMTEPEVIGSRELVESVLRRIKVCGRAS